ncbi:MAG: hypothetical protein JRI23_19470 [Deltaproteobacteria bacterium]|jgi:hypothetical protein|nr:hypothetical protein [Deltaproteobacteria bacterium]MBW2534045.1 hypothetical protein [Deltaproteobacteria bacterium]
MRTATISACILVGTVLAVGCAEPIDGQQTQDATSRSGNYVQGAEEIAALALVNDCELATFEMLDVDCAIRADAARNIVAHRDGVDQSPRTADDNRFDTQHELLGVDRVGEKTMELLTACAQTQGYLPTAGDLAVLNFLNDQGNTTLGRLDVDCGLYSDAATNLVAHRDGPDGLAGTVDDDYFHSRAEVDGVDQVGPASMDRLHECAARYGYATGEAEWRPIPIEVAVRSCHSSIVVWQSDGVVYLDGRSAPEGAQCNLHYYGEMITITRAWDALRTSGIERGVPEGFGAEDLGMTEDGVSRIRFTKDPVGTISSEQALTIAKLGLIEFIQDERMHEQDWHDQLPSIDTWEEAVAAGIMDGIWGYCDRDYEGGCGMARTPDGYSFWGRGPFRLYTVVEVSKATQEGSSFYVQID